MKNDLQPIDKALNDVHTLLTNWMSKEPGYILTADDVDAFDQAEETLDNARNALYRIK